MKLYQRFMLSILFLAINLSAQPYSTLLHTPLSELTVEQVQSTILLRLNEMPGELKLQPYCLSGVLVIPSIVSLYGEPQVSAESGLKVRVRSNRP